MTPDELRTKKRLFSAAMLDGDFLTAEQLAIELEPYTTPVEDDCYPLPVPAWGIDA